MAQDTLEIGGIPLQPVGMNDNVPLESDPNFYQTRGIHSLSERVLQRCNGKRLLHKLNCPVLAIHGDLRGKIYVETSCAIYQFDKIDDDLPSVTPAPFPTEGLVLHLETDSLILDDNDPVDLWNDQSELGNDATQSTPANQPIFKTNIINGLPIIRFSGNHRLSTFPVSSDFGFQQATIFLIRNNVNNAPGLSIDSVTPLTDEFLLLTKTIFHHTSPSNFSNLTHQDSPTGFFLQSARMGLTTTDLELWINGVVSNQSIGSNGTPLSWFPVDRGVHIGGREESPVAYLTGDIAAVLVFDILLSDPDRLAVETYLMDKYAL